MKNKIIFFLIFIIITGYIFRGLLINISDHLLDWRDYSLIVWIITQNIEKIISLNFSNFFDTNAFFPNKYTLFFADTFIPQSLLGLPFWIISKNPILTFNIIFFLTLILNYISSFLLWKFLFKKDYLAFFGSIAIVFSPFFHTELSHFQMLSFWPYLFSIYFLLKFDISNQIKFLVFSAIFLAIQFLGAVYFSVFLIFTIFTFFLLRIIYTKKIVSNLKYICILIAIFLLLDGVFIKGYFDMKSTYQIKRDLSEFVTYSAHLSDYIFTTPINSLINKSYLANYWNSFDKHNLGEVASFPCLTIFILGLIGIIKLSRHKELLSITFNLDRQKVFFILLILMGFIFSLGPRLNFNGNYAYIPLPYSLILKVIPISEAIRVTARWSFLFYFGFTFFALLTLFNIKNIRFSNLMITISFIFLILELIPFNISAQKEEYINNQYSTIRNICFNNKKVLLEIPVTHLDVYPGIVEGVDYIGKVELSSLYHGCFLKNGYSGYDLPSIFKLRDDLYQSLEANNIDAFIKILKYNQVDIIKINQNKLIKELAQPYIFFDKNIKTRGDIKKIDQGVYIIVKDRLIN